MAVIPLALTVLLLISGFTPILRTLSDPNTTWTGFAYQAMLNRLSAYALAVQSRAAGPALRPVPDSTLQQLHDQAKSSLDNPMEYPELDRVEAIGAARLSRVRTLFEAAGLDRSLTEQQAGLALAIQEAAMLNEQSHERIHQVQGLHARQLERLRLVLLLAAALSGLLSTALIWRSLQLWRKERRALDGQRELLSLASHELRRPLQSLLLATDLLSSAQSAEERLRYLSVVESSAAQLASRADLDQLETMYGRIELNWQPVDLTDLLLEFRGPRTDVQVQARPPVVQGDPARLRQIVENLHENALRYSAGPVALSLTVEDGRPKIQVRDSGPGVDPDDVERLFQARERGAAALTGDTKGRGLGLTIARRLVQAHGADLTLTPAPEGGTLATLRLAEVAPANAPLPVTAGGAPGRLR